MSNNNVFHTDLSLVPLTFTPKSEENENSTCLLNSECELNVTNLTQNYSLKTETPTEPSSYLTGVYNFFNVTNVNKLDYRFERQQPVKQSEENAFNCPLCSKKKENFFCSNCIRNGDFTHSRTNILERFADKKLKFIKLKGQQIQLSAQVQKQYTNVTLKDELDFKIREIEKNIKNLNYVIADKKHNMNVQCELLEDTKQKSNKSKRKHMQLKTRIDSLKNLMVKLNSDINGKYRSKAKIERDIQHLIREAFCTLTAYIFPLSEEFANNLDESIDNDRCDTSIGAETTPLLNLRDESCSNNSLIEKESKSKIMTKYKILDTWLSSSDNYQAYFSNTNLEYLEIRESNFRNDGYRITSALSYLCQITNLIAKLCDVHLPKKILFCEFYYNKEFKMDEFLSKIAKLNTNILFLCIFNRIDPQALHPKHAFKNLQTLLNSPAHIGKLDNYIEISNHFYRAISENLINDLSLNDREEYQHLTESNENEFDFVENNIPDLNFASNDQGTGMPSLISLMISSFYKRTTGQK